MLEALYYFLAFAWSSSTVTAASTSPFQVERASTIAASSVKPMALIY